MMPLRFERDFDPGHGRLVAVAPGVRRLTAENPSPFTFRGTNSYIVGTGQVALIDPGPDIAAHLATLAELHRREPITHILVTHSHRDHTDGLAAVQAMTGAATHAALRRDAPATDDNVRLDAGADQGFRPDVVLADGDTIAGEGWSLQAIATPGHASDHLCFALGETGLLFSGDHVMGWSTTVVTPPDGDMAAYMTSLDRLLARQDATYLPGHGGPVTKPRSYVSALKAHRRMREAAILKRLAAGDRTVAELVAAIYRDTDPRLHRAAGQSVRAHLIDLVGRGVVKVEVVGAAETFTPG